MAQFDIRNLTFQYPEEREFALRDVSLSIRQGEFVLLTGPSGCGKTTLLKHFRTELTPAGRCSGAFLYEGSPIAEMNRREQTEQIGFVGQDPDAQILADKVWHEMAFGLESLGKDGDFIRRRVAEMAAYFGIADWFHKDTATLSGGQKQRLNLAAAMTLAPRALVLDEPTAMLDPIAAGEFLQSVGRINRELGVTVIMTEHRLEESMPLCTRFVEMRKGSIVLDEPPQKAVGALWKSGSRICSALPAPMRAWAMLDGEGFAPMSVREGREWLARFAEGKKPDPSRYRQDPCAPGEAIGRLKNVWFRYEKDGQDVLRGFSLEIRRGEILALMGANGVGKTSAMGVLAGLEKPWRGDVRRQGRVTMLPQRPQALFSRESVMEELQEVSREDEKIADMARFCDLTALLDRNPWDLSGGEMQRVALAKVLLTQPDILLLDEPTKGLDVGFQRKMAEILRKLAGDGMAVVMVSHDVDFCARYAHRIAMAFDGSIAAEGAPRTFFPGNHFYTTAANRMAREILPDALTAEDIAAAFGVEQSEPLSPPPEEKEPPCPAAEAAQPAFRRRKRLSNGAKWVSAACLAAIPLTILAGVFWMGERRYAGTSLLVLLEAMLPFVVSFEGKKPFAREIALLSAICAVGVAGRAALFMVPAFKPVLAVVIVSGVALGAQQGFLVGAMTMFVSNFFFGQGPWTPWQMLGAGLTGLVAALLFRGQARRSMLCAYGAAAALLLYGVVVNVATVFLYQHNPTPAMFLTAMATGLPSDLTHAVATAVFLWLFGESFLRKIMRVRRKIAVLEER